MTARRYKSWLKNGAAILFGIFFALVILEIAARILHLGTGGFWEPYSLYGWRNIPNASGWESCYGECQVFVEINSKGLRDNEISYEKPEGTKRVFLLGDSLTAAMQVQLGETYGKVAEQQLNDRLPETTWEVVNGGVNGFGTDNELIFYREEGKKYEADIVVLGIYLANDIYNNSYELETSLGGNGYKPYFLLDDEGQLQLQNFPVEGTDTLSIRVGTFLKKHFQLPRFVAHVLELRRDVPPVLQPLVELVSGQRGAQAVQQQSNNEEETAETEQPAELNGQEQQGQNGNQSGRRANICARRYVPQIEEAWAITKALILQLQTEVEAEGAQLVVLVIPAAPQLIPPDNGESWYCDRPNEELNTFLDETGIPYLDLLQPFRQNVLDGGGPYYYDIDFHLNTAGHQLAGELFGDYLSQFETATQP